MSDKHALGDKHAVPSAQCGITVHTNICPLSNGQLPLNDVHGSIVHAHTHITSYTYSIVSYRTLYSIEHSV